MNKRIVYTRPDGGVSVVVPTGEVPIEIVMAKDVPPDATNVRVVDAAAIPPDRTFRDAWQDDGAAVKPNMVKAAAIHMGRIRASRNAELAKLDVPQLTAITKADTVSAAAIETQKQTLRDLPATFDLSKAATPEALKALWPVGLPR